MKNKHFFLWFLILYFSFSFLAKGQDSKLFKKEDISKSHKRIHSKVLPTVLQEAYDVKWIFINLNAENDTIALSGNVTIKAQVVWPIMDTFSFHLHHGYIIDSIKVDGEKKPFINRDDERLVSNLGLNQGQFFNVQIFYHGYVSNLHPRLGGINTAFSEYGFNTTWTLSEPNNAYQWFPVKQDLTDKIDSVWVFVTTSNINKVASNGLLTSVVSLAGNKVRYEWKSNYPIDYYLISIAIANYQDYSFYVNIPQTQDSILIQNYIYNSSEYFADNKEKIDKTKDMIIYFSDIFGQYPFKSEKYGHVVTPIWGGMEHQTMTTLAHFGEELVAHELAHQWFGDNVTCGSWEHIWLNEGFATYSVFLWNEFYYGKDAALDEFISTEIENVLENGQTGSVYIPESYIDDEERIFDGVLSYSKGACLLHMLRFELSDDNLFFNILKTYQQQFANNTAVLDDFKNVLEELSEKDFTVFFNQWYYGEGYPIFNLTWEQLDGQLRIQSEQTTTASITPLYKTPFEIRIDYSNGTNEVVLFFQEFNSQIFTHTIPTGLEIDSITFDPSHWLLAKHTINEGVISIQERRIAQKFSLYPNPTNDIVNIQFNESLNGEKKIELINIEGQIIKRINTNARYYQLDISTLSPGIYQLVIYSNGEIGSQKLIKQ